MLKVLEMSNPVSPVPVGQCRLPDLVRAVAVADNTAYVAGGPSGLFMVDVSLLSAPRLARTLDTPGNAYDVAISGNTMLVADGASGICIYDIVTRTSSLEALEAFRANPDRFDLVITDQTMPQMTGIELAQEMLRIRPDIPVILCTGFSEAVTPEKAKSVGIREYLMKPLVMRQMADTISRILDKQGELRL
jgi:CheY-like chemotaxis protein